MQNSIVMTVIGPDSSGIVDRLASMVREEGGNWLESRLIHLGGQFAGVVRVDIPKESEEAFKGRIAGLKTYGLKVEIHEDQQEVVPESNARVIDIELIGQDRPGIISQIAGALTEMGANIEELNSQCVSAAMSGEELFEAEITITVSPDCSLEIVRERLEKIASDLMVDLEFDEAT
ncbi:MAG: ACT domain-containing protein [Verrucomicrobiota bacterium]